MRALTVFILILSLSAIAPSQEARSFRVADAILIDRDFSVSPDSLCHDGVNAYFKAENLCLREGLPVPLCQANLPLAPLREMEQVSVEGLDQPIYRLFKLELSYTISVYEEVRPGHFELNPVVERGQVDFCQDKERQKPRIVFNSRKAVTLSEREFLSELVRSGFIWIISGRGNINSLANINENHFTRDQGTDSPIDLIQPRLENIRSPLCHDEISHESLLQIGGEQSGNGFNTQLLDAVYQKSDEIVPANLNLTYQCANSVEI